MKHNLILFYLHVYCLRPCCSGLLLCAVSLLYTTYTYISAVVIEAHNTFGHNLNDHWFKSPCQYLMLCVVFFNKTLNDPSN